MLNKYKPQRMPMVPNNADSNFNSNREGGDADGRTLEIRKLNSYIKTFLDSSFSYSLWLDRDTKIQYHSDSFLSLAGVSDSSSLIGKPVLEALKSIKHSDFFVDTGRRLARIMAGENGFVEDETIVWPNAGKRIYRIAYRRLKDDSNDFDGILITLQDITDIRLEESEQRLNDVLQSTVLPCLIWDKNGDVVAYNKEASKVFGIPDGLPPDEFSKIFFSIQPRLQPDGRSTEQVRQCVLREALEKGFSQIIGHLENSDGKTICFSITVTRISWLFGFRLIVYYYDKTEIIVKDIAVKEAEERMQIMFDSMPFTANLIDNKYHLIDCNQEALHIFGLPSKEEYSKRFYDLSPEFQPCGSPSIEMARHYISKAFDEGYCCKEWIHQKLNGEQIPCEVTLIRMYYKDDYYVMGFARDLREVKAAQEEADEANERVKLMLDSNPMMCIMRDEQGKVIDCNQEALNILGAPNKAEFCANYQRYFPEFQPDGTKTLDNIEEYIRIVDAKGSFSMERTFQTLSGEEIPVETIITRIPWKNTYRYVSFSRDLREAKANEQKMKEITEREREAKIKSEVAHAASAAKSLFLSNMSHEIRTPMNSIIGFSELALDGANTPQTRGYLGKIMDNATWLLQIIDDILDISKIESGNMELENAPFDLYELVSVCESIISQRANAKNIGLHFYPVPPIGKKLSGDLTRLRQVLINLLTNAVKFTDAGMVSLSTCVENIADGTVTLRFEIKDTGIGMTPEQIGKIFDPFTQADVSTTRKYGGTGLGLTITKNILDLMGSRLDIESAPGAGSKFSFAVDFDTIDANDANDANGAAGAAGAAGEAPIAGGAQNEHKKPVFSGDVLICEDNQMNQQVIIEHLARVGLYGDIAGNGLEGIEKIKKRIEEGKKPYDLVFMDIHMPVMDGIEATKIIMGLGIGAPIVAMTANIMSGDRELYKSLGMSDYIGKPYTSHELWHCLSKHLKPLGYFSGAAGSDEKLQHKLKANFVRSNQTKSEEIAAAIESNDITLAHRLAHTLKGNAGLIGQSRLQNAAADVESLLQVGATPTAPDLAGHLGVLGAELKYALDELKPFAFEAAVPARAEPMDSKQARQLLGRLEQMLENINPECVDLLEDIHAIPGTDELSRRIRDYDFESAAQELSGLMHKWA